MNIKFLIATFFSFVFVTSPLLSQEGTTPAPSTPDESEQSAENDVSAKSQEHVSLRWIFNDEKEKMDRKSWVAACQNWGKKLLAGQGPWGWGAFDDYSCYLGQERVSGKTKKSLWSFNFQWVKDVFTVVVKRHKTEVARFTAPLKYQSAILSEEMLIDLTLFYLFDRLPFSVKLTEQNLKGDPPSLVGAWKPTVHYPIPVVTQEMKFYTIDYDEKNDVLKANIVGLGLLQRQPKPPAEKLEGVPPKSTTLKDQELKWKVTFDDEMLDPKKITVYGRPADTSGRLTQNIPTLLSELYTPPLPESRVSLKTYYALGVMPTPKNDLSKLLPIFHMEGNYFYKKLMVGMGLDLWPKREKEYDNLKTNFSSYKIQLNVGLNPIFLKSNWEFSVVSQFGFWTMKARLPLALDPSLPLTTEEVAVKAFPFMGIEAGASYAFSPFKARVHGGGLYTLPGLAKKKSGYGYRMGAELFWNLAGINLSQEREMQFDLFSFYFYETFDVNDLALLEESPLNEKKLTGISLTQGFVGLGLQVRW